MKKLIVILILGFTYLISNAQYPVINKVGNDKTLTDYMGSIRANGAIVNGGVYADTSTANLNTYLKAYDGAQIMTTGLGINFWLRYHNKWYNVSGASVATSCVGLQLGGIVTWDSLMVFDVTAATYCINNKSYSSASGRITLNAAHSTLNRVDVIALDTLGAIVKITGTPSANPSIPQVDLRSQLYLTAIYIPAGSTIPINVVSTLIWDENIGSPEYNATTSDAGISFINTTTPYHKVRATSVSADASSRSMLYSGSPSYTITDYSSLRFFINLNAGTTTDNCQVAVYLISGSNVSSGVMLDATNGFNTTVQGSYQNITIPLSEFSFLTPQTTIDGIYFKFNTLRGFYLDYITLNGGVPTGSSPYITDIFRTPGNDSVFKVINGVPVFAYIDSIGSGGGGSVTGSFPIKVTGSNVSADTTKTFPSLVSFFQLKQKYDSTIHVGDTLLTVASPLRLGLDTSNNQYTLILPEASPTDTGYVTPNAQSFDGDKKLYGNLNVGGGVNSSPALTIESSSINTALNFKSTFGIDLNIQGYATGGLFSSEGFRFRSSNGDKQFADITNNAEFILYRDSIQNISHKLTKDSLISNVSLIKLTNLPSSNSPSDSMMVWNQTTKMIGKRAISGGGGSGTVTSVDMTLPSWLSVSGNPITTSGTLAITAATGQAANKFLATPDGTTGAASLRSITTADLPAAVPTFKKILAIATLRL